MGTWRQGRAASWACRPGWLPFTIDQVVRAAPAGQVPGVGALGVQGVRGDHRPGQADTVQQDGEHRDLIRLRRNIDLPQDHLSLIHI